MERVSRPDVSWQLKRRSDIHSGCLFSSGRRRPEHQVDMPQVAQPEELMDEDQTIRNELEKGPDHLNDYFTSSLVQIRQVELNP